jgi:hypothetical protein
LSSPTQAVLKYVAPPRLYGVFQSYDIDSMPIPKKRNMVSNTYLLNTCSSRSAKLRVRVNQIPMCGRMKPVHLFTVHRMALCWHFCCTYWWTVCVAY